MISHHRMMEFGLPILVIDTMKIVKTTLGILAPCCVIVPLLAGISAGRSRSLAKHLLFDMAVHRAALSQLDTIPDREFSRTAFDIELQKSSLREVILQIDEIGFEKVI